MRAYDVIIVCPTLVDPVNPSLRTSGCSLIAVPTMTPVTHHVSIYTPYHRPLSTVPEPGSTFMTPGGNPASTESSQNFRAVRGVTCAGLRTTVLPAARQAAIFQASIIRGQFQGVIMPQTLHSYKVQSNILMSLPDWFFLRVRQILVGSGIVDRYHCALETNAAQTELMKSL